MSIWNNLDFSTVNAATLCQFKKFLQDVPLIGVWCVFGGGGGANTLYLPCVLLYMSFLSINKQTNKLRELMCEGVRCKYYGII